MKNEEMQEKIRALTDCINELSDLLSANKIIPQELTISLQEVSDGYIETYSDLAEEYAEVAKKNAPKYVSFQARPITSSFEEYSDPLILISDETELDAETSAIIRKRHENGYLTFPIILFSDVFFQLVYGENCSYLPVIEAYEAAFNGHSKGKETLARTISGEFDNHKATLQAVKVMAFRKSEYQFIDIYLICVSNLIRIHLCNSVVDDVLDYLQKSLQENERLLQIYEGIPALTIVSHSRAILQLFRQIEKYCSKPDVGLSALDEFWRAEINKLREKCDRQIDELINKTKTDKISRFALDIDLKYGPIRRNIHEFLYSKEFKRDYGDYTKEIKELQSKTEQDILQNAGKISLIGTFSSGKTTLINTFLGEREIPLRTSMAHNTAVLMQLFYESSTNEYYEIIYRDKMKWTVIKPDIGRIPRNRENCNIQISSIIEVKGGYQLRYMLMDNSRRTLEITIRTSTGLAVKVGDIVMSGQPFTKNVYHGEENVELCSRQEIILLIQLLQKKPKEYSMTTMKGKQAFKLESMIAFLNRLLQIAGEKRSVISYVKICGALGIAKNGQECPVDFRSVEIECSLDQIGGRKARRELDKRGWLELCGAPDSIKDQKNNEIPFCEKPECYMLAKELQLHVHAEFLESYSLTDTPGFGSVTEEHDRITERYIMEHTGKLLVMIAINSKTMDAKLYDLINNITYIYDAYRKNKKDVVFILNCFTNNATEENLKGQVKNVHEMLIVYGYSRNNIYVCNLRDSLVKKQEKEEMFGYPSYKAFHDDIQEMIFSELSRKYKGIQKTWQNKISNLKKKVNSEISNLESGIEDIKTQKDLLNQKIANVENRKPEKWNADDLQIDRLTLDEIYDEWNELLITKFTGNRKGVFKHPRFEAVLEVWKYIDENISYYNAEIISPVQNYYQICINSIAYILEDYEIPKPDLDEDVDRNLIKIDIVHLRRKLEEADSEVKGIHKRDKERRYTQEIREIIMQGLADTKTSVQEYCDDCYKIVDDYYQNVIIKLTKQLDAIKDEKSQKDALNKATRSKKALAELEKKFNTIKFDV